MRVLFSLVCIGVGSFNATAQIAFTVADLPSQPGQYSIAYVRSEASVTGVLGNPGGPQQWDFSQAQQAGEFIRRMDIVPPADTGQGFAYPNATYAERFTDPSSQSWDLYRIDSSLGQIFYGTYSTNFGGEVVFPVPAADIPSQVGLGTNWSYSLDEGAGLVGVHLSASASADAYGTLLLPQLGQVAALRVNQLTTQQTYISGMPFGAPSYFREYYWLVPGLGKALHIVSDTSNSPPSLNFTTAYEVRRMFEAGGPVSNVQVHAETSLAVLSWPALTNASAYQIQWRGSVVAGNWQLLTSLSTNSWTEPAVATQRFYRVFFKR